MKNLNWNVVDRSVITDLDELSTFHYQRGIGEEFQSMISPNDMSFPIFDSEGNYQRNVSVEFSLPIYETVKWEDIKSKQSQTAQTTKSLHPLLLKFVRGKGPRAIYVGKKDEGFEIELFEDISVEPSFRFGRSKLMDARGIYRQPYHVPKIQDILNETGFQFLGHYRFNKAILVGNQPSVSVFGIRTVLEDYVIPHKGRGEILATLPCYDREKKDADYEFMDFYVR